jgi:fibronectin-binding autotransporter adhesin
MSSPALLPRLLLPALVLTAAPARAVITWDGSSSANWATAANWDLNRLPNTVEQLIFPATGLNKAMNNDRSTAANGHAKLTFSAAGYTLSGLAMNLIDPSVAVAIVEVTHGAGTTTLSLPMVLQDSTRLSTTGVGSLVLTATADISSAGSGLTLESAGLLDVNSTISGPIPVNVAGTGVVRMDAPQTYTGNTSVQGALMLTGSIAGSMSVSGMLRGTGTIAGNVAVSGDIDPGDTTTGRLTINGNLTATVGVSETYFFDLVNATAGSGHDQIRVGGTVVCEGAGINLLPASAFPLGTPFVLIDKTSAGAIDSSPSFSAINEGTIRVVGVNAFQFSYTGGDGNDFTATVVPAPPTTTRIWDGGAAADLLWSSAANWTGDVAPTAGQVLNFGGTATADVATVNDTGGNFSQITFTGTAGGFTISPQLLAGNALTLNQGIAASQSGAACSVNNNLVLAAAQSFALTGAANLSIGGGVSVQLNGFDLTAHCAPSSGTPQLNLDGNLTGTGNLIKTGTGRVQIGGTGTSGNSYSGTTTVQEGELRLTRPTILGTVNAIPGALIIGGGVEPASVTTTVNEKIADTSAVTVNANGSFLPGGNETIGALTLNGGVVNAGTRTLTINGALTANVSTGIAAAALNFGGTPSISVGAGATLTLSQNIAATAALTKTGPGKVIISGVFSQPAFTIAEGTVELNGDASQSGTFTLQSAGTVSGEGSIEAINASAGGIVQPLAASTLKTTSFTGGPTAIFRPDISTSATASSLDASTINLGNMKLDPVLTTAPVVGDTYIILTKPGTVSPTTTRFTTMAGAALAQNAILTLASGTFRINYSGGDGNDISLTATLPADTGVTRVWDGGAASDEWRTAANWVGDIAPLPGDSVEFPATAHVSAINNFPAGMTFSNIRFTGVAPTTQNRSLTGNAVQLLGGISSSVTTGSSGASTVNLPATFLTAATVTNTGTRTLTFQQAMATTVSPLRFTGAGNATLPLISLTFNTPITGPAQIRVEGNASLNANFSASWSGGTIVENGVFNGPTSCALGGFTVGLGTQTAVATLGSQGQILTNPIVVNALGSLTIASPSELVDLTANSGTVTTSTLTINGALTLHGTSTCTSGSLTVAGTIALTGNSSLTANAIAFTGSTRTITAATGTSITTETLGGELLTNQNALFNGGGTLRVNTRLATDALEIAGSILHVEGGLPFTPGSKGFVRLNNGRLIGNGRVNGVTVAPAGGIIAPGTSSGLLTATTGGTLLNAASALQMEINGPLPGPGYDRLISSAPDMQGAALQLTLAPSYAPLIGQEFVLVQNLRALGLPFGSGFGNIAEGSTAVLAAGVTVRYSYVGGDGNDFSATVTTSPAGAFRTWDGGGADANWMTAANWVGDVLPAAGESLLFPAGAVQLTNTNNFPATTLFDSVRLTTACTLNTGSLTLTGDLTTNLSGTATVSGVRFLNDTATSHMIQLEGTGSLNLTGNVTLGNDVALTLRRTDPAGTLPALLVASVVKDGSAVRSSLIIDGGGRVHFTSGTRNCDAGTHVRHGTLQIVGGAVPGNLTIGGGAGPAVVENPGDSDAFNGRLADLGTITLLPGGTHLMTGATPLERVGRIIYAGGQLIQPAAGRLRTLNAIEVAENTDATINTPVIYDFPSNDTTDLFQVGTGGIARLTSTINADNFQTLVMEKTGPGSLLITGGTISGAELRITEGLVAPLGSGVTPLFLPVSVRGGAIGGNGRINQNLSGTAGGGSVAPGGGVDGRGLGALTVGGDFLPAPQTTLEIELGGAQNDQLIVQGSTADLNNASLLLSRINGFTPTTGQTFTILNKTSAGPITRTFGSKPQGSTFNASGFTWSISYTGGDGNDVILTAGTPAIAADLKFTSLTIGAPSGGGSGQRIQSTLSGGAGAANATILLQFSDNLQAWTTLTNTTADAAGNATFDAIDTLAGPRRFYRAMVP